MPKSKLCFIVGPIGAAGDDARIHADWVLHYIIKPVLDKRKIPFDLSPYRTVQYSRSTVQEIENAESSRVILNIIAGGRTVTADIAARIEDNCHFERAACQRCHHLFS